MYYNYIIIIITYNYIIIINSVFIFYYFQSDTMIMILMSNTTLLELAEQTTITIFIYFLQTVTVKHWNELNDSNLKKKKIIYSTHNSEVFMSLTLRNKNWIVTALQHEQLIPIPMGIQYHFKL